MQRRRDNRPIMHTRSGMTQLPPINKSSKVADKKHAAKKRTKHGRNERPRPTSPRWVHMLQSWRHWTGVRQQTLASSRAKSLRNPPKVAQLHTKPKLEKVFGREGGEEKGRRRRGRGGSNGNHNRRESKQTLYTRTRWDTKIIHQHTSEVSRCNKSELREST